jgi:hypothetical protein
MGPCDGPVEVMTSPELRETSSQMFKVTRSRWYRKDPIPWATGDASCIARELKVFPYGRNIGVVVSEVMDKDHQEAQQKKRKAPLQLVDLHRDAKMSRPSAKGPAPAAAMPPPMAPVASAKALSPQCVLKQRCWRLEEPTRSCLSMTTWWEALPCLTPRRGCRLLVSGLFVMDWIR